MGPSIAVDGFQEMARSLFRRSAMYSSANLKYLRRYFQPMATNSGVTIDLPFLARLARRLRFVPKGLLVTRRDVAQ